MLSDVPKSGDKSPPCPINSTGSDQEIDKRIIQYRNRKHFTPYIFVVKVTGAKWFETFSEVVCSVFANNEFYLCKIDNENKKTFEQL